MYTYTRVYGHVYTAVMRPCGHLNGRERSVYGPCRGRVDLCTVYAAVYMPYTRRAVYAAVHTARVHGHVHGGAVYYYDFICKRHHLC